MNYLKFLLGLVLCTTLAAHVDDPKIRDMQPRYEGPGYRAGMDLKATPNFSSSGITLESWITLFDLGSDITGGSDCWGYVSPSGREYALLGLREGTAFVEVTDPGNPVVLSVAPGPYTLWRDIKAYGEFAYVVGESGPGIQVFDLRQIDDGTVTFVKAVEDNGPTKTHNVAVNRDSGFLYRCAGTSGGNVGLRIFDLTDPSNPVFAGEWHDRYVHDAEVVSYRSGPLAGHEIAFCNSGFNGGGVMTGLSILDVTNKADITVLAHVQYPNGSYSHQGRLSPDRRFYYMGDELDEQSEENPTNVTTTFIFNVVDPANPVYVGSFTNGNGAIDHNLFTKGRYIFEANYRSGLRIYDAINPTAPVEVGHFDSYTNDDLPNFNGLWASWPYFPSGTIIGSDLEKGLFVWRAKNLLIEDRLIYPWISNSDDFESTLILNNYGSAPATVVFSARRAEVNGVAAAEVSSEHTVAAHGFLKIQAGDLFPTLGNGSGYTVVAASTADTLSGRWVTSDTGSMTPSQGLALKLPAEGKTNDNVGKTIEFGFLPGSEAFQAATVLVNTEALAADVTIYYFDEAGNLADTQQVTLPPRSPYIGLVTTPESGNLYAVAVSEANITGAVFVFNAQNQTAIGNVSVIGAFNAP